MKRDEIISYMNQYVEGYSAWGGAYKHWDLPVGLTGKVYLVNGKEIVFKRLHYLFGFTEEYDLITLYHGNMYKTLCGYLEPSDIVSIEVD